MTVLEDFMLALVEEDTCPVCLGYLDEEYNCTFCPYNANPLLSLAAQDVLEMLGYD